MTGTISFVPRRFTVSRFRVLPLAALVLVLVGCLRPAPPAPKPDPADEPNGLNPPGDADRPLANLASLLQEFGGTDESERAVALGLAWLAKQQKPDGGWAYDQGSKEERVAATGMALLPFIPVGETHKPRPGSEGRCKYTAVVANGLAFLRKLCPPDGPNAGRMSTNMYAQGIGTLALCDAYRATRDRELRPYVQAALNYIQRAQSPNGSWGYAASCNGDTSITGWQIQALWSAKLARDLVVDERVIRNAIAFLNLASAGEHKSMYGYGDSVGAAPGTSLTAVGLWSRACIDGWGPNHPGMVEGASGLLANPPAGTGAVRNLYYLYYATQVVRFFGGDAWRTWNEGRQQADGTRTDGMRDWLVRAQVREAGANEGSWNPEAGWFGSSCGRLGTTAICVLTLEVYYRPVPRVKRASDFIE
jgi:hypothetical protein